MPDLTYRQAALADAGEIHDLLLRLAPEIPLLVDTLEREEALYALTRACTRGGESWVACDTTGRIVGFVLVELVEHGRHYAEHEVLELHYAGIAPEHRRNGVFAKLIENVLARLVLVMTAVSPQNRSGAARQFEKHGFQRDAVSVGEPRLRWIPGRS
ncbi:MAG TPA: GNAT family N-acetyltransferase [Stellaceae bacterium]|nr:GNAT family N-acetyltransferase [Stellaceae bacterium]